MHFNVVALPDAPISITGPAETCPAVLTKYTAASAVPGTLFAWSVTTGWADAPSAGATTYAKFTGSGPWTVNVWHEDLANPHCHSDTLTKMVHKPVPTLSMSGPTSVCGSTTWTYTESYTAADKYDWYIWCPGSPSDYIGSVASPKNGNSVVVTWNNPHTPPGEYAKLIVKVTKCFDVYFDTLDVFVMTPPVITLTGPDTACNKDDVYLNLTAMPVTTSYTGITWDWGDGMSTSGGSGTTPATLDHVYYHNVTGGGAVVATVTLTSPNGCPNPVTASHIIWIKPTPVAQITPIGPLLDCSASGPWSETLTATATVGYGSTANYVWYKSGSGTPVLSGPLANALTVTSAGLGYGIYFCIVFNSYGCSDTTNLVTIADCPPPGPGCVGTPPVITLTAVNDVCGDIHAVSTVTGATTGYSWYYDYPGVPVSTSPTDLYVGYGVAGNYEVAYTVSWIDGVGNTCYETKAKHALVPYIVHMNEVLTCSGSTYTLTLLDNSNVYPGIALTHTFKINSIVVYSGPLPYYTTSAVTPGTSYTVEEIISGGGYPPCSVTDILTVPALPVASFVVGGPSPACSNDVSLLLDGTSSTGYATGHWDFGDLSTNDEMATVSKVYVNTSAGPVFYPVTLTVTSAFGCTASTSATVTIIPERLRGTLVDAPHFACEGDPVTLTYTPATGFPGMPSSFTWHNTDGVLFSGVIPHITVYEPGGYWVDATDVFGCEVKTDIDTVTITFVPHAHILGDTSQCINADFTLSGYAGSDPGIFYQWMRDGSLLSGATSAELSQIFALPGTHTYRIITSVANPGGGYCYDTSEVFKVTVHSLPPAPTASFAVVNCNDYLVKLTATDAVPGTFYWSNGAYGSPAFTYVGGPYAVFFTDTFGCTSHKNLYVDKDPRAYLWVFPTGCFEFCSSAFPFDLLGPSPFVHFLHWQWLRNMAVAAGGSGAVPNYTVTGPGQYNLVLGNAYCRDTSGNMDIKVVPCPAQCACVKFAILGVIHIDNPQAGCYDSVILNLSNSCWKPYVSYTITADHGAILYGSGVLGMGAIVGTYRYIADPGFAGPVDTITVTYTLPDGSICIQKQPINIKPCDNSEARNGNTSNDGNSNISQVSNELAKLLLIPNPAQNSTSVDYVFTGSSTERYIEMYDMTGRLVSRHQVGEASGRYQLSLLDVSAGLYQIVLRQDGNVFLQAKLSVTR